MAKNEYRVLRGIDYPPNKRAEIGAIVSDLPKESISWLRASGVITDDLKSEVPVVKEFDEIVLDDKEVGEDDAV